MHCCHTRWKSSWIQTSPSLSVLATLLWCLAASLSTRSPPAVMAGTCSKITCISNKIFVNDCALVVFSNWMHRCFYVYITLSCCMVIYFHGLSMGTLSCPEHTFILQKTRNISFYTKHLANWLVKKFIRLFICPISQNTQIVQIWKTFSFNYNKNTTNHIEYVSPTYGHFPAGVDYATAQYPW